jgi:hypothetical protein
MKKRFRWKKTRNKILQIYIRIILGLTICAATISTIYIGRRPYGGELKEGDVSLGTIYAPIDFSYEKEVDEKKTKLGREKAAAAIDEIYQIDNQITQNLNEKLDKFFNQIVSWQAAFKLQQEKEEKIELNKSALPINISEADIKILLAQTNIEDIRNKTKTVLTQLFAQGIISVKLEKKLAKSEREFITLRDPDTEKEKKVSKNTFLTLNKAKKELIAKMQNLLPEHRKLRIVTINILEQILQPNVTLNEELTKKRRQVAYDNAPIEYKMKEVKKDELIIARGQRVNREHLLKIKGMLRQQVKKNRFSMFFSGAAILTLIFLALISFYLKTYEPKIFLSIRKLTLTGILFVFILAIAKVITLSSLPSFTIPTAIASILLAILIGPRLAIMISIVLSIFVGIIAGDQLNVATVSFVGSIVGIFFIQGARRRSQILISGCLVGIANFASICALELLHGLKYVVFLKDGFWGIINGLGTGIIVTGILPVFEYIFKIITNISLLELSDINHPLLKEMVLKAPGTYHHSLIVGNLAEAACDAIGANSLLARVGSYFHDIGKIEKAEYFSENQVGIAKKKHDKLTPSMSSLIITNHVKDGVELARKYKLNQAIIDFTEQHHGTSLIFYFYQRALEKVEADEIPKEEGFRYPGPKPQTKETAVVLLADSVEAASRTLSEPTPARIKGLVRKIINNKFIDSQLDQCELTLKDLEVIGETFARILMGIFHSRVEYEKTEEKSKGENKKLAKENNYK